jgi:hypothetical protein
MITSRRRSHLAFPNPSKVLYYRFDLHTFRNSESPPMPQDPAITSTGSSHQEKLPDSASSLVQPPSTGCDVRGHPSCVHWMTSKQLVQSARRAKCSIDLRPDRRSLTARLPSLRLLHPQLVRIHHQTLNSNARQALTLPALAAGDRNRNAAAQLESAVEL